MERNRKKGQERRSLREEDMVEKAKKGKRQRVEEKTMSLII